MITVEELRGMFQLNAETGVVTRKERLGKHAPAGGEVGYLCKHSGYRRVTIRGRIFPVHRIVWALSTGAFPEGNIDHINGVRSDNRLSNLRDVTSADNSQNRGMCSSNTSGVVGVSFHTSTQKWRAQIKINEEYRHIGIYDDFRDAVIARRAAERALGFHENHGRRPAHEVLHAQLSPSQAS